MCECTCGCIKGDVNLAVQDSFVTVDAYFGCQDCAPLVGIDVSVFTENGARKWLQGATIERAEPDDYGGPNGSRAACFEMFSMDDLAEAANLLGLRCDPDWENWREYMREFGVKWMRAAATCCQARKRREGE